MTERDEQPVAASASTEGTRGTDAGPNLGARRSAGGRDCAPSIDVDSEGAASTVDLEQFGQSLQRCEQRHVGQEYPFCENWGCMSIRPLFNYTNQLQAELAQAREQIASYETGITWDTTCLEHAHNMDMAYARHLELENERDAAKADLRRAMQVVEAAKKEHEPDSEDNWASSVCEVCRTLAQFEAGEPASSEPER